MPGLAERALPQQTTPASGITGPARQRFGDYELIEELGQGGMGVVFKARQLSLNRIVALKMIQSRRLASPASVQRFRMEAETAASLHHTNIAAIHEIGEHNGQHFFSMDLIEGRNLEQIILEKGPGDFNGAARWVQKIAQAVHHAHQQGILHRDLKPSNILVDADGEPHVSDFGLARRVESDSTITLSGEIIGSPAFMAPEQASGQRRITVAADIYSLGGILYELLTGRPPFAAATPAETMHLVLHAQPVRPWVLNRAVPRDLETICLKCLEKEPARRYGSAQELAEELGRFLADQPIRARQAGTAEKVWRWARRNPVVAGLAGAAFLLLLTVAIGSSIAAVWLKRSSSLANRRLYHSLVSQAEASRWSGRPGRRFDSLSALHEASSLAPQLNLSQKERLRLRQEVIASVSLADVRVLRQWLGRWHPNSYLAWDANLEHYVREDQAGQFSLRRVSDDEPLVRFEFEAGRRLCLSRGGRRLAIKSFAGNIRIWDVAAQATLATVPSRNSEALDISLDGQYLAADRPDKSLFVLHIDTGREQDLPFSGATPNWLRFSPDGQKLAVTSMSPPLLQVWDLSSGTFTNLVHTRGVLQIAWRPDSETLAAACADWQIYIWNLPAGRVDLTLEGHQSVVHYVDFDPTGRWLASWSWDGSSRLWDTFGGTELLVLPGSVALQFSADGQQLSFASGLQVGVWEVALGDESARLQATRPDDGQLYSWSAAFSPNGDLLATASTGGLHLRNAASSELLAVLPSRRCMAVAFHPRDGTLLVGDERGLSMWPAQRVKKGTSIEYRVGPPQWVVPVGQRPVSEVGVSAEGETVLAYPQDAAEALLLEYPSGEIRSRLEKPDLRHLALSSDGRWIAGGNWHGSGVRLWNALTGEQVKDLPASGTASAQFSADNHWLLVGTAEEYQFWETGSWNPGPRLPRTEGSDVGVPATFSPDGTLLAIGLSNRLVQLVDAASCSELATLDPSAFEGMKPITFSPHGSRLAVQCETRGIRVWNLSHLRDRLAVFHLDWPGSAPPHSPPNTAVPRIRVRVLAGPARQ